MLVYLVIVIVVIILQAKIHHKNRLGNTLEDNVSIIVSLTNLKLPET